MATPKPGEIRCPTCHRSTPPAAFCTQCGSAIPPDARIRPRGMDRDELQERIRARRSGGDPYRRGGPTDDDLPGYERFEPEPEDARARQARSSPDRRTDRLGEGAAGAAAASVPTEPTRSEPQRPDLTRDDEDEWAAAGPAAAASVPHEPRDAEPAYADAGPDEPAYGEPVDRDAPTYVDTYDDEAYGDAPYPYDYDYDERERRPGAGALPILGFLALGVLALLGGAVLAGVFSPDSGVGQGPDASPTPSASVAPSQTPSPSPTADETPDGTPDGTGEPPASGDPVVFPDGFVAETQPCLPGSAGTNGCDSNARSNSGSLWVWVGFENGTEDDVIGAALIGPDGNTVGTGSIDLADIGCRPTCPGGWTYFPFSNLPAGDYEVEITRNGEPAGSTSFEVG